MRVGKGGGREEGGGGVTGELLGVHKSFAPTLLLPCRVMHMLQSHMLLLFIPQSDAYERDRAKLTPEQLPVIPPRPEEGGPAGAAVPQGEEPAHAELPQQGGPEVHPGGGRGGSSAAGPGLERDGQEVQCGRGNDGGGGGRAALDPPKGHQEGRGASLQHLQQHPPQHPPQHQGPPQHQSEAPHRPSAAQQQQQQPPGEHWGGRGPSDEGRGGGQGGGGYGGRGGGRGRGRGGERDFRDNFLVGDAAEAVPRGPYNPDEPDCRLFALHPVPPSPPWVFVHEPMLDGDVSEEMAAQMRRNMAAERGGGGGGGVGAEAASSAAGRGDKRPRAGGDSGGVGRGGVEAASMGSAAGQGDKRPRLGEDGGRGGNVAAGGEPTALKSGSHWTEHYGSGGATLPLDPFYCKEEKE